MEREEAVDDGPCDDNELDGPEFAEDEDDDPPEPSLGSIEKHCSSYSPDGYNSTGDQTQWAGSGTKDLEDEHDGSEPSEDDEPALGSFDRMVDQSKGWQQRGFQGGLPANSDLHLVFAAFIAVLDPGFL